MHAFNRRTDGQTDTFLVASPNLQSMQRGNNFKLFRSNKQVNIIEI